MTFNVVCLRPEADFLKVEVTPPAALSIAYRSPDDPQLAGLLKDARALVIPAVGPKLAADLFAGSAVKLVQVTGAGVDRLDAMAMKEFGIAVCNVVGGSNEAVAEYVLASALVLLRRFAWADGEIRAGNYEAFRARMIDDGLRGVDGLTVGVVGFGNIGISVARAFLCMGAAIAYYDPTPADAKVAAGLDATSLSLDDLLATADVVTLHVPLLPETRGLIGKSELARMKPEAILVNAARGGVVDEAALADALASGRLGGAALDVYEGEPPPEANPLFLLEGEPARRVLFTPHIAGVTCQSWARLFRSAWENVEGVVLHGQAPRYRIF
ncbi:MAG: NAD(P)-binding domain-containing protein [Alphaproteobacteria bacterium]|nr:NAD(P)-binding domain-containing protein [Alphaproteobacteria bacterium]